MIVSCDAAKATAPLVATPGSRLTVFPNDGTVAPTRPTMIRRFAEVGPDRAFQLPEQEGRGSWHSDEWTAR
jgi:hypothetical protein